MQKIKLAIIFSLLYVASAISQQIKSIQLRPSGENVFTSIVPLGSTLHLSFDDLDADSKDYSYKVQHMTHDWKPSNMLANQYINGFQQNTIINVTNSFNTFQSYTHYEVSIPNKNTVITKSGNYLLSVIDEYDDVVFSRRFVLYEDTAIVAVNTVRSRDTKSLETHQTVHFTVNHPTIQLVNPEREVFVSILQNQDWNTNLTGVQPQFFKPNQLVYKYINKTNFDGGNEYLHFDNKYLRNTSATIVKIEPKEVFYHYLYQDIVRKDKIYTYNPDINGQFLIRTLEARNSKTEADYALMHFSLQADEPFSDKVYVYGAYNNFETTEENQMVYDTESKSYKLSMLLKQGFYNYKYVTVDDSNKIDLNFIDGNHFQTENEYTVLVYYKPIGGIFDRVIGIGYGYFNQNR